MAAQIATWMLLALAVYLAIGVLFAVPFLLKGVQQIDAAAKEGTKGFRVLIFPGVVALWPLLWKRWRGGSGEPPEERAAHRQRAGGSA